MPFDLPPKPSISHEYLDPRDYRSNHIQELLKKIALLESSGGTNTNHHKMEDGIHAGDQAVGTYGIMPNTLKELANKYPSEVTSGLSKDELEISALADPKFANTMAGSMGDYLKNKRGLSDEETAAAWEQGHHTPVEDLDLNSKRAYKFRTLNGVK